jgi:hypothetical protein
MAQLKSEEPELRNTDPVLFDGTIYLLKSRGTNVIRNEQKEVFTIIINNTNYLIINET